MLLDDNSLTWSFLENRGGHVFCFKFSDWKRLFFMRAFPDIRFHFAPRFLSDEDFQTTWAPRIKQVPDPRILIWGVPDGDAAMRFAKTEHLDTIFVEDGFIRSASPHASAERPVSLAFDNLGPHFSYTAPSRLETILAQYDFEGDPDLLTRARDGMAFLLDHEVSKYNSSHVGILPEYLTNTGARKILVVGQVEDDAAMLFGSPRRYSNNEIVRQARLENPDAEIIYRVHPDVVNKVRPALSDPAEVMSIARIMTENVPISQVLKQVDAVYTITSLVGFEALMRGLPVTVFGVPFYAGWGLTDDRQTVSRRTRKLSVVCIFAAAYLLYPTYFDRHGNMCGFETSMQDLKHRITHGEEERKGNSAQRFACKLLEPAVRRLGSAEDLRMFRHDPEWFLLGLPHAYQRLAAKLIFGSRS
jgi:capsule polysaccharide export protein KpsC/LpsZ